MQDINHWCVVCGKGYHACDSCLEEKTFKPWRTLTDSIDHYKIFMILRDYDNKLISKTEAKKMLENVNIDGWQDFKESSKKVMSEIMKAEKVIPEKKGKVSSAKKPTVKQVDLDE